MIKVALAGFGLAGKVFHAPLIAATEGLDLSYVVSSREDEIKQIYPNTIVLKSFEEIFTREVDLIVLATPNHLHFEQARKAIEHNINVVIDKPIAQTLAEASEIYELSKQRNVFLNVFHNRRFDGDFLTLKRLISDDKLGRVVFFESNFNRFRPVVDKNNWRETTSYAGGVFFDLAPHLIDQACDLFGSPIRVLADIKALRDGAKNDDYFHVIFDYGDKKIHLNASCITAHVGERFKVHGDKDSFIKFGLDPQEGQLKAGHDPKAQDFAKESVPGQLEFGGEVQIQRGNYLKYYQDIVNKLNNNLDCEVTIEQGLMVMKLVEACLESQAKSAWVKFL